MSLLDDILAKLDAMPAEAVDALKAKYVENRPVWLPNVGAQAEAYYSKADVLLYGGSGGGGKGGRPDDKVLTPFGWRKYRDLKVGDAICAVDGTVTHVIGVYPRGVQPTYRFTWSDGATTVVDGDHIWRGWWTGKTRKIGNEPTGGEASTGNWITTEIAEMAATGASGRFSIPVMEPCAFNVAGEKKGPHRFIKRHTPPYVLGVLLGDGSITGSQVSWTKPDEEVAERVRDALVKSGLGDDVVSRRDCEGKSPSFGISTRTGIREHLEDIGLMGLRSEAKFIPRMYLLASIDERWELLRGLMDTDGWSEEDGECYFATSSMRLADDVTHLARSLGAIVSRRDKSPTYTYLGERRNGLPSVTLRLKMQNSERMFHLERKASRCRGFKHQSMGRYLERIDRDIDQETICIKVRHPSALYVTDDFVVTHNSDLGLGLAFTAHRRSLILRRRYANLSALTERAIQINGSRNGFNGSPPPLLRATVNGIERFIQFGANQHAGDEEDWQGHPFDLKYADESTQFLESQIRFHMGWLRSTTEGQRTRMVLGTNPPIDANGDWIVGMFRPWLDLTHSNPAKPGDLRWYVTAEDGSDVEIPETDLGKDDKGRPCHKEWTRRDGTPLLAMSRTFIPAALKDNPYLANTDYGAKLDGLPEPLRSAIRDGNFMAARSDADFQVIPTQWVIEAQARWKPDGFKQFDMTAMALDPAGGGKDSEELTWRHGPWFAEPISAQGEKTSGAQSAVVAIFVNRRNGAPVVIDAGGGYAGAVIERLEDNSVTYIRFNGASSGLGRTKDSGLPFANKRAEVWWKFREALDPSQPGGSEIALPPDPELRSDLTTPCLDTKALEQRGVIQIESKESIRKRIGRSPGKGDAAVMCWSEGSAAVKKALRNTREARPAFANVGHASVKGHRFRR
jgi:hypothetical protein